MDWALFGLLLTSSVVFLVCLCSGYISCRCHHNASRIVSVETPEWTSRVDIEGIDADALDRYTHQLAADMDYPSLVPDLTLDVEFWPNGTLSLGPVVYAGHESTIFSETSDPKLLIKYQTDCDEVEWNAVHPLLRDFWYGKAAYRIGVAPKPLFISQPTVLVKDAYKVRNMKSTDSEREACISRFGAVRFMVMERRVAAISLFRFTHSVYDGGKLPFSVAMQTGIRLIEILRDLHQVARVIHGDIHANNILVEGGDVIQKLLLTDFSRARANIPARSKYPVYQREQRSDAALTHWQMLGYEWSARDDVYNALLTVAALMNGKDYIFHELRLKNKPGPSAMIEWRQSGFIFATPGPNDVIDRLAMTSNADKQIIRKSLQRVLDSVRSLLDVDDVPDYDFAIEEFRKCFRLAPIYS
jgi:hypothetical protein